MCISNRFENVIDNDFRTPFYRYSDRIVYSLSYTRYMDKTQVFSFNDNDNISKRMTHVQMVSKIARTIGRALNLNEDLIEAMALGHDIGHTPFGHSGEEMLNRYVIPIVVLLIVVYGFKKKVSLYDCFIDGAKDGLKTLLHICFLWK